jgi:hypothetical protein
MLFSVSRRNPRKLWLETNSSNLILNAAFSSSVRRLASPLIRTPMFETTSAP